MRIHENFLAYTAYQKAHRASARQWPCTMDAFRQAARAEDGYDATNRRGRDGLNQAPILAGGGEKSVFLENLTTNAVVQLWPNRNRLVVDWSSHLRPRLKAGPSHSTELRGRN